MDSAKDANLNLALGDMDGAAAEWLCWRSADLKSLPVSFGSSYEFGQAAPDKEIAAQAVAFVVNSSRKGIVSLCADVASLMRARRSLEERLAARGRDTPSRLSGDAAACCSCTTRSGSSSSSAAAAAHVDCRAMHGRGSSHSSSSSNGHLEVQPVCKDKEGSSASPEAGHSNESCGGRFERQRTADQPPLPRQASVESSSCQQQRSCTARALGACSGGSSSVDTSCEAAACACCRLSAGSSSRHRLDSAGASAPNDERRNGCLPPAAAAVAAAAGQCEHGDGRPMSPPTPGPAGRRYSHECPLPEPRCRATRSCCTSDDEASTVSSSCSRGIQVNLQLATATDARSTPCSCGCSICDEHLRDALQVNAMLQRHLSAAQRELSSLRAKLARTPVAAPDQVPPSPRSQCLSPVSVTNPIDLLVAAAEHRDEVSRRKSRDDDCGGKQSAATRGRAAALLSPPSQTAQVEQRSPLELTGMLPAQPGKGRPSSRSKAARREGRSASMSESGGSSSTGSPSAWGALGRLRRLIRGASVGGTTTLPESGSSSSIIGNVRLNDEVLTTCNRRGVVRYVGSLDDRLEQQQRRPTHVGLQLYEPVGTHDGTYEGKRYFSCEQNHGILVALQDIKTVTSRKRLLGAKMSGGNGSPSSRSTESAEPLAASHAGPASDDGTAPARGSDGSKARAAPAAAAAAAAAATITLRSKAPVAATAVGHGGERQGTVPTLHHWTASLDVRRRPPSTAHMSST